MSKKIILSLTFIVLVSFLYCSCSNREISEKLIAKVNDSLLISESLEFSPDYSRVAYLTRDGSVFVDGVEKEQFHSHGVENMIFSPDSRRIAYLTKNAVIIDGAEGKYYDKVSDLVFSPDSKRVAYVAYSYSTDSVVIDGIEGKKYDYIIDGSLTFSWDSKHVAYFATVDARHFLVVDGKEGKYYDDIKYDSITFSPDGNHLAYEAALGMVGNAKWFMIIGVEYKQDYNDIKENSLIFSPDSKRIAYSAGVGKKWFVVVDGVKGSRYYNSVGDIVFSPDSKRIAYWASTDNKDFVVVDGVEGKQYDGAGIYHPVFSPDSRHLAYSAKFGDKSIVVVDEKEESQYDEIYDAFTELGLIEKYSSLIVPIFSPDSKHVAYLAGVGGRAIIQKTIVVDGKSGRQYDSIHFPDGIIVFDSSNSFHYNASRVKSKTINSGVREFYLIEEKIK
jgi:WD40 repeat protein